MDEAIFYYFNLHMDHVGVIARREAAKLVVARIREIAQGAPVVLTGDFNVDQTNEIYAIFTESGLLKDSYDAARIRFAENGTFNAFKTEYYTTSRIDHVFVSPEIQVESYGVLTNSYWTPDETIDTLKAFDAPQEISFDKYIRRNPSDHYPVFVKVKF
jgi:endonuclease/exonuclease/phosphatase family metal-dependent hydrolase